MNHKCPIKVYWTFLGARDSSSGVVWKDTIFRNLMFACGEKSGTSKAFVSDSLGTSVCHHSRWDFAKTDSETYIEIIKWGLWVPLIKTNCWLLRKKCGTKFEQMVVFNLGHFRAFSSTYIAAGSKKTHSGCSLLTTEKKTSIIHQLNQHL